VPLYPWGQSPRYPLDWRLGGPRPSLDDVEKRIGIGGMESDWVHSALRPPVGLLCQARVIMIMGILVE
jgi:hypothetical protein